MPEYTVTVDRGACEGIFACLVRDERFVEADDGLVAFEPDATAESDRTRTDADQTVSVTVDAAADGTANDAGNGRANDAGSGRSNDAERGDTESETLERAREAAAACPVDAIDVTVADGGQR